MHFLTAWWHILEAPKRMGISTSRVTIERCEWTILLQRCCRKATSFVCACIPVKGLAAVVVKQGRKTGVRAYERGENITNDAEACGEERKYTTFCHFSTFIFVYKLDISNVDT